MPGSLDGLYERTEAIIAALRIVSWGVSHVVRAFPIESPVFTIRTLASGPKSGDGLANPYF